MTTTQTLTSMMTPRRGDPRMKHAIIVAGVLSATAGVQMLLAGTAGFPAEFAPTRGDAVAFLIGWSLALVTGVVTALQRRTATAADPRKRLIPQAIVVIALLAPFAIDPVRTMLGNPTALLVCMPSTAFGLWSVHRMQRYRRMPAWLPLAALAWGAMIAAGFAGASNFAFSRYAYGLLRNATDLVLQRPQLPTILQLVHVGLVEELGKVLGVAMAYVLLRRHFDGVVSGLVLGAAVGLGFNFAETINYMSRADAAYQYWGRQSVGLMASHTAFSALAGAGFGMARQLREPGLRRVAIASGFMVAVWGHFAANSVLQWFSMGKQSWFAVSPTLDVLVISPIPLVATQGPLVVMYLLLLRRGLRSQAAALATHLPAEARSGLGAITGAEATVLLRPARRLWLRITVLRRHGVNAYRNLKRIHAAQLDLATQRWHRARQEVDAWAPAERVLRERVLRLKDHQVALTTAPPQYREALA